MKLDRDVVGHRGEPKDLDRCCKNKPTAGRKGREQFQNMCDTIYNPAGYAAMDVIDFARDNRIFYKWYLKAW